MTFNHTVVQDGQTYRPGEEVPDMGSIACIKYHGNQREYVGLSKDIDKLPKYENLASGSSCLFLDNSSVYMYESTSKKWYEL